LPPEIEDDMKLQETTTVSTFYADDHARLDRLFALFLDLKRKEPQYAKATFQSLNPDLNAIWFGKSPYYFPNMRPEPES